MGISKFKITKTQRQQPIALCTIQSSPDTSNTPKITDTKGYFMVAPLCTAPDLYSVLLPCITPSAFKQYMTLFVSAEEDDRQTAVQGSGSS
ncbi:uncharacterized protein N7506_004283 [Penicillium brevicompactum]|uniref:uncharacterized protein n=1 Tax=Penicillium brevicompactum TaxID=5074 RepID=UPI0025415B51|nr:uncharacterized protein N7506_004283 [Penicillium brevicompactum]KAJ5336261.1 hypothetical protein N7506_004283 [Penicillium brevicompactum]